MVPARFRVVACAFSLALALFALTALTALSVTACRRPSATRTKVAVSIFPIFELTRRIAAGDADVVLVAPKAEGSRGFEPTEKDAASIAGARVAIMVGLGFDPWMETLVKGAAPNARLLKTGDRVPSLASEQGGAAEPYFWLDPDRARIACKAIGEELARSDGAHASAFRKRAAELDAALELLDREIEEKTNGWKAKRLAVDPTLARQAAYFADRYKLELVPAADSNGKDPSRPKDSVALDVFGSRAPGDSYESIVREIARALERIVAQ